MGDDEAVESKSTSVFLQIKRNQDGSITRPFFPLSPPLTNSNQDQNQDQQVLIKDVPLNLSNNTYLRLYLPKKPISGHQKLPVILFFHGGGFVLFGPSALLYHLFCYDLALSVPALVVSLACRLAPEHRLPAAYDDAVDAVAAVRAPVDPWIAEHGDLNRLFVMGSSSGGNMAYHTGLRAPSKIAGLVLNQPYFGGTARTKSEAASVDDPVLPLCASDMMWGLALPEGADRDHEYCNPTAKVPTGIGRLPRCLVKGSAGDPLVDRQREFVGMLEGSGVDVTARFDEDGHHAVELFDEAMAEALFDEVREFVGGLPVDGRLLVFE